jgi:hypothetical protein
MYYVGTEFELFCTGTDFDKQGFEALIADIRSKAPEFDPRIYRRE